VFLPQREKHDLTLRSTFAVSGGESSKDDDDALWVMASTVGMLQIAPLGRIFSRDTKMLHSSGARTFASEIFVLRPARARVSTLSVGGPADSSVASVNASASQL